MTDAATGLVLGSNHRRAHGRVVQTIAEMSPQELLAGLPESTKTELHRKLAGEAHHRRASAEHRQSARFDNPAFAKGFQEASERGAQVMAHPEAQGRERVAAMLLAKPQLSASEIIELLADQSKPEGHDFLARLAGGTPSGDRYASRAEAAAGWKKAVAKANAAFAAAHPQHD